MPVCRGVPIRLVGRVCVFFLMIRRPRRSPLFPYPPLFRSVGLRRDGIGSRTRFSRPAVRRNDRDLLACAHLLRKSYGAGGVLQLRSQGDLPAATDRWQTGSIRQPHHHGRRLLRATLCGAFCPARSTALILRPCEYVLSQVPKSGPWAPISTRSVFHNHTVMALDSCAGRWTPAGPRGSKAGHALMLHAE